MTTQRTLEGEFDYVIVGAGTAGCVLANRLTEDPDIHVLLLEAGGKDDYHWIHIPVGYLYCIGNPRTDWLYKTQPEAALNGRALSYPRGRVLGGCSSINGMIYMRGQREDYDSWAQETGDAGWSWDSVLPIFKRSEDHHAGASDAHGAGGYWRVEKQRLRWEILESFAQAAQQTGIPATDDFNRGDNSGVGYFEVNQKRGVRWNTSKAFLRPAMTRPNLTVITGAQAQRVVFDGRRAVGVEYRGGGTDYVARARAEVLLTSGAVNSPQLLELSGIGAGHRLQALGIDVVQDLPGVGENLQDHLQLRMAYRVEGVRTLNTLSAHWCNAGRCRWRRRSSAHSQNPIPTIRRSRVPISNTTCSRCRSSASASRCTVSTPLPHPCAICGRARAAACMSPAPIRVWRPRSRRTICRPITIAMSPRTRCDSRAGSRPRRRSRATVPRRSCRARSIRPKRN